MALHLQLPGPGEGAARREELRRPRWAGPVVSAFLTCQELSRSILTEMEKQPKHYRPLVCEKSKPVPLKLFTPRLVKV